MATLHLLGTGAALSDQSRTTTMLAIEGANSLLVVDCGGDAAQRLLACGLDLRRVSALIVTHEHADHVGGFPLLMERLWLAGHRDQFHVYGIRTAIEQARKLHDAFDVSTWPSYPRIVYHEVEHVENAVVLVNDDFEVLASPGEHSVPVVGLRFRDQRGGGVAVYSCDTQPSDSIARLAKQADLLLHEASGSGESHSSAAGAAGVAVAARAKRLVLVHLPASHDGGRKILAEARALFPTAELSADGDSFQF